MLPFRPKGEISCSEGIATTYTYLRNRTTMCIISTSRGKSEGRPEGAKRPTAGNEPREFTSRGEGGRGAHSKKEVAGRKNSSGSASTKKVCHCEERKRRSNLDRKDCFASLAMTRSHLWGVATILANTFFRECTRGACPPFLRSYDNVMYVGVTNNGCE